LKKSRLERKSKEETSIVDPVCEFISRPPMSMVSDVRFQFEFQILALLLLSLSNLRRHWPNYN